MFGYYQATNSTRPIATKLSLTLTIPYLQAASSRYKTITNPLLYGTTSHVGFRRFSGQHHAVLPKNVSLTGETSTYFKFGISGGTRLKSFPHVGSVIRGSATMLVRAPCASAPRRSCENGCRRTKSSADINETTLGLVHPLLTNLAYVGAFLVGPTFSGKTAECRPRNRWHPPCGHVP